MEQEKVALSKIEDVKEMVEAVKIHYRKAKYSKFNEKKQKYDLKIQPSKLCKKFVNILVFEPMNIDGFEHLTTHVNKISKLRQQIFSSKV